MSSVTGTPDAPDTGSIRDKAVRGARVLGVRTVVAILLRLVSSLTLARFLSSRDFGVFGVVSGVVGVGLFFCEFSLNNILISQKEEPSADEAATVFWIQQSISFTAAAIVTLLSSWILHFYRVDSSAAPMLCVGIGVLFLVTLRSVPMAMMERHLDFEPLARSEVAENVTQIVVAIALALTHFGPWSLLLSGIAARTVGMVIIRSRSKWSLTGRFRLHIARELMGRASRYQMNYVVTTATSFSTGLIIARAIGVSGYGLVTWASNIASAPMMMVDVLNRVTLPALSRLQGDPSEVGRVTGRAIRRLVTVLALAIAPLALVAPFFLPLIFGEKWRPAVILFQWNISEVVLLSACGILAQTILATGLLKERAVIAFISGVLRISLIFAGVRLIGVYGAGAGAYLASLADLVLLAYYVRRTFPGSETLWGDVFAPLARVQGAFLVALCLERTAVLANTHVFVQVISGLAIFAVLVGVPELINGRRPLATEVLGIWNMLRARRVATS